MITQQHENYRREKKLAYLILYPIVFIAVTTCFALRGEEILGGILMVIILIVSLFKTIRGGLASIPLFVWIILLLLKD